MKETKQKLKLNGVALDEELDIFGEHKTREQVRAEEKERRIAERKALQEEIAHRRKEAKESGTVPAKRKDVIAVTAVLVGIVLLCLLALASSFFRSEKSRQWEIDESRGYILKDTAYPEMSAEGPKADVYEIYFTKNNHLCVNLYIGNGTDKPVRIDALDVAVYDNANGELIAGGKATLEEDVTVLVSDTAFYTFYISPEHIHVDDKAKLPEVLDFDILIDSTPIVE